MAVWAEGAELRPASSPPFGFESAKDGTMPERASLMGIDETIGMRVSIGCNWV